MSDRPAQPVGVIYATGLVHEVRWSEICPWLILVKALRVALLVRVLVITAIGVILTEAGWNQINEWFAPDLASPPVLGEVLPKLSDERQADQQFSNPLLADWQTGTLVGGWRWLTEPFLRLGNPQLGWSPWFGTLLYGLWAMVVWSFLGGAVCRISACYLSRGETLGPLQALRSSCSVFLSTLGGPVIVLLAVLALAVPLILLGMLLRIDLLAPLVAVIWCFVLAWGFMLVVILTGLMLGWPLMWACLGVERSDAFDGVSRCYAYVYQRPLQLGFFVLVAAGLGLLGGLVVEYFAAASLTVSEWVVGLGLGSGQSSQLFAIDAPTISSWSARAIGGWKRALDALVVSFPVANLWAMSVGIYLLLRRQVDATEMEEITLVDGTVHYGQPAERASSSTDQPTPTTEGAGKANDVS